MEQWLRRGLQAEVRALADEAARLAGTGDRGRRTGSAHGPRCRVGRPGGRQVVLPSEAELHAAGGHRASAVGVDGRADLLDRALGGLSTLARACAWVTCPGPPTLGDVEVAWLAAAAHAFARHGVEPSGFFVVGPGGHLDALTGEVHRARRAAPAAPGTVTTTPAWPWDDPTEGGETQVRGPWWRCD